MSFAADETSVTVGGLARSGVVRASTQRDTTWTMPHEFLAASEACIESLRNLREALDRSEITLLAAMDVVREGGSLREYNGTYGWKAVRGDLIDAVETFMAARAAMKGHAWRLLMEHEHMTATDIGKLVDRPRQVVRRQIDAIT